MIPLNKWRKQDNQNEEYNNEGQINPNVNYDIILIFFFYKGTTAWPKAHTRKGTTIYISSNPYIT